jgi:hypothetical protein
MITRNYLIYNNNYNENGATASTIASGGWRIV